MHKIRESKIGFWLRNNYPKLLLGYTIFVITLLSITKEVVWTAEEINDVLTIEWTIFGLSLTVFLVWNVLIVEYLKKRKPANSENDKCKSLAKKIKEIIDTKSSFADWLNNQIVRDQLKFDIKVCLIKNGYPPQYSPEVFRKVMEQVENFEENN